eukprot:5230596-Amphidinium_carterae.1
MVQINSSAKSRLACVPVHFKGVHASFTDLCEHKWRRLGTAELSSPVRSSQGSAFLVRTPVFNFSVLLLLDLHYDSRLTGTNGYREIPESRGAGASLLVA